MAAIMMVSAARNRIGGKCRRQERGGKYGENGEHAVHLQGPAVIHGRCITGASAVQVKCERFFLNKEAESDTLNDAADKPTPRCFGHVQIDLQYPNSAALQN